MIGVIGAFDGYHRGHQALFAAASKMSQQLEKPWRVVTFQPRPRTVLAGAETVLFTDAEMTKLDRWFGLLEPVKLSFDERLRSLPPEAFLEELLRSVHLDGVVVGQDFRFGYRRSGGEAELSRWCSAHRVWLDIVPSVQDPEGQTVSSTRLRKIVASGDVTGARRLLGYGWFASGTVENGQGRGKTLGFPTANMSLPGTKLRPADGVYAGAALVGGHAYAAAISVGINPTFGDVTERRVEAFLLDMEGDLYRRPVDLFFLQRLRPMIRFQNSDELSLQIGRDADRSRELFARLWPALPVPVAAC